MATDTNTNANQLDKIIRTLDLAKSDARDKTAEGIVEYILFCVNEPVSRIELIEYIKEELTLELHEAELADSIDRLIDSGSIINSSVGSETKYSLSKERYVEIKNNDLKVSESRKRRYERFVVEIDEIAERVILDDDKKLLWDVFTDYIYECYLRHGKSALYSFFPEANVGNEEIIDLNTILKSSLSRLPNKELQSVFKKYVSEFPTRLNSDTLDYLMTLANKAEAFFALGLSKEQYTLVYQEIVFDWTIFVDTNFLYSILDLHAHPENKACKAVLELGQKLNIKFKYLPITLKELENRKRQFEFDIDKNLKLSQIRALVESGKLDNFTSRYYEKKIADPVNTPHPTDVINHAPTTLHNSELDIYRSNLDSLTRNEEYLRTQESKFADFHRQHEENRAERGLAIKGAKDPHQLYHDIVLREAILFYRKAKINALQDVRYFGLTLDQMLIKFDLHEVGKSANGTKIPSFFAPSVLLKKLIKYKPVEAQDYRRAFIGTISTPALDDNLHVSKVATRSVKYFYNMGIEDERLILNCLKDEHFLDKFESTEKKQGDLGEFIESELNAQYRKINDQLDESRRKLNLYENEAITSKSKIAEKSDENVKLGKKIDELGQMLTIYQGTISSMRKKTPQSSFDSGGQQLTIDDEEKSNLLSENADLSRRLRNVLFKKWQIWGYIAVIPAVAILVFIMLMFAFKNSSWNFVSKMISYGEEQSEIRKEVIKYLIPLIFAGLEFLLIKLSWKRLGKNARKNFEKSNEVE